MPNLTKILSIFLKLQAVKQSGLAFLACPVDSATACFGRFCSAKKKSLSVRFVSRQIGQCEQAVRFVELLKSDHCCEMMLVHGRMHALRVVNRIKVSEEVLNLLLVGLCTG